MRIDRSLDLSVALDPAVPADPPPLRPRVTYLGHKEGAGHLTALFPGLRA